MTWGITEKATEITKGLICRYICGLFMTRPLMASGKTQELNELLLMLLGLIDYDHNRTKASAKSP